MKYNNYNKIFTKERKKKDNVDFKWTLGSFASYLHLHINQCFIALPLSFHGSKPV